MRFAIPSPECKLCGSPKVVKFGNYRGIQRWWCHNCRHKFADNQALAGMKTPSDQVAQALELYFQGVRLTHIPDLLCHKCGVFVSFVSVYYWVEHFCQAVTREFRQIRPNVDTTWILNEVPVGLPSSSRQMRVRDVIDVKTHYLLSSDTIYDNTPDNLAEFIHIAATRADRLPQELIRLESKSVEQDHGDLVFEFIKYWRRVSTPRTRIIQSLRKPEKIQPILNGWSVQYNFLNRQNLLSGQTPAAAAQLNNGMFNWPQFLKSLNLTSSNDHRLNHNSM